MHPTIRRARDLLARLDQQEVEHQVWREQHAEVLENDEIDALLAKPAATIKQRHVGGLIFKERDNALVRQQQSEPEPVAWEVAWDRWCDNRIARAVEMTARALGEEVGAIERGILAKYDAQIAELYAGLAALRLELEQMRAAKKGKKPNAA